MSWRQISDGAEITPRDIDDVWSRGRAELFADIVGLANDWGRDVYDFLELVYNSHTDLGKSLKFEVITLKRGKLKLLYDEEKKENVK